MGEIFLKDILSFLDLVSLSFDVTSCVDFLPTLPIASPTFFTPCATTFPPVFIAFAAFPGGVKLAPAITVSKPTSPSFTSSTIFLAS